VFVMHYAICYMHKILEGTNTLAYLTRWTTQILLISVLGQVPKY